MCVRVCICCLFHASLFFPATNSFILYKCFFIFFGVCMWLWHEHMRSSEWEKKKSHLLCAHHLSKNCVSLNKMFFTECEDAMRHNHWNLGHSVEHNNLGHGMYFRRDHQSEIRFMYIFLILLHFFSASHFAVFLISSHFGICLFFTSLFFLTHSRKTFVFPLSKSAAALLSTSNMCAVYARIVNIVLCVWKNNFKNKNREKKTKQRRFRVNVCVWVSLFLPRFNWI